MKTKQKPELHDCRGFSSLTWSPREDGKIGTAIAHEGRKPFVGDYLVLGTTAAPALYRVLSVDLCMNVDPAKMWLAQVEFVRAREAAKLFPDGP